MLPRSAIHCRAEKRDGTTMNQLLTMMHRVAEAIEAGDTRRVRHELGRTLPRGTAPFRPPLTTAPETMHPYEAPSLQTQVSVMARDGWSCRFCHTPLAPSALLWALHDASPRQVHYNYRARPATGRWRTVRQRRSCTRWWSITPQRVHGCSPRGSSTTAMSSSCSWMAGAVDVGRFRGSARGQARASWRPVLAG
jgi:hypothetical protein